MRLTALLFCCIMCVLCTINRSANFLYDDDDASGNDNSAKPSRVIIAIGRFMLGEIVVEMAKSPRTPYLMFRLNHVCAEASRTEYGVSVHASVGEIQLVDKIHTSTPLSPVTFCYNLRFAF